MAHPRTRAAGVARAPRAREGRHRAADDSLPRGSRTGQLWPLGALVVLGLVGARTLRGTPLPDDDALAVPAYGLLPGGAEDGPLSPDGLAATHTAAYAAVTRAFSRHLTLIGAEREVLLVALLVGAFLVWRTARRLGVSDESCALGLLVVAALLAAFPIAAVATPAALAVPWAALAGLLGTLRRPPVVALGLATLALLPAVMLAPDLLLVVVAAVGTALATRAPTTSGPVRTAVAGATVVALVVLRLLLPRWEPETADPTRWGGSTAALVSIAAALLLVAVLAAVLLPVLRPAAAGLLALTVLAVVPPSGRVPALVLTLPLAVLLLAGLADRAAAPLAHRAGVPSAAVRRTATLAAAVALVALVALAGGALTAAPRDDFGAAGDSDLLAWAGAQLPPGATLDADPVLTAELQHAGAPAGLLATTGAQAPADGPVLRIGRGANPGTDPGSGAGAVVARFDDGDRLLTVTDPAATAPDPTALDRRRRLGAAVLASPRTQLPATAAQQLRDGAVDPRLLTLLAGMVARFDVRVADLPAPPGEEPGAAARSARVTAADGGPLTEGSPEWDTIGRWLEAQRPPLAPEEVRLDDGGLLVGFRYVTDPDGVVAGAAG